MTRRIRAGRARNFSIVLRHGPDLLDLLVQSELTREQACRLLEQEGPRPRSPSRRLHESAWGGTRSSEYRSAVFSHFSLSPPHDGLAPSSLSQTSGSSARGVAATSASAPSGMKSSP